MRGYLLDHSGDIRSRDQAGKVANPARGQLNMGKWIFPCPRSRLRICSRETASAVPARVSLFILHTQAESGAYSWDSSRFPPRRPCIYAAQPKVALSVKTRMVKAEANEALLYGCSTWTLRQERYAKLGTVYHRVLLWMIGAQRKRPDRRMTSYNRALEITGCESIETTLRTRRLLWAGGGRLSEWAAGGCQSESYWETFGVQCGEDGVGRRKSGPTAYRATCRRLAYRGIGKQRRWRQRCGLRQSQRVDGGLWPRGEKKR